MACDAEDCAFQIPNDDELVTSMQEESDPVNDDKDVDKVIHNDESSKSPSNADAFSALETAMEWYQWRTQGGGPGLTSYSGSGASNFEPQSREPGRNLSWYPLSELPHHVKGRTFRLDRFKVHQPLYGIPQTLVHSVLPIRLPSYSRESSGLSNDYAAEFQ
ncbi:hypothetical protein TNCV_560501 [Trichonephila clavipes]|nr:hypothetical protein TNCV_560501 [Trichonephila clavipes]